MDDDDEIEVTWCAGDDGDSMDWELLVLAGGC